MTDTPDSLNTDPEFRAMVAPGVPVRKRVTAAGAAAILGMKRSSFNALRTPSKARRATAALPPEPDGRDELFGHPWWYADTIEAFKARRPGRGFRADLDPDAGVRPAESDAA